MSGIEEEPWFQEDEWTQNKEIKMEQIEIVEEKLKQDKNGDDYANVKLADGRYVNLMFGNFTAYDGPGIYNASITKNGKFWNMQPGSLAKTDDADIDSDATTKTRPTPAEDKVVEGVRKIFAPKPNTSQTDTNRAILLQVCIKSAAEVYHGSGKFMPEKDAIEIEKLIVAMASKFLAWAEKNAQNNIEEIPF